MKRNIVVFSAISSVIIAIMMTLSVFLHDKNQHYDLSMVAGFAGMILAFSMIYAAIKNYRDKYNNGVISFGQAFKMGFLIALITSTVYVGLWMIEQHFFYPDFMEKYTAHTLEQAKAGGISNAEYDKLSAQMTEQVQNYKNPFYRIMTTYAEIFPIGILAALVCALILKRKQPAREMVMNPQV